ncbi:MAG: amino acid adenylation domain-containing protein [Hassallia sp. WJT32-NPBG1]|jgi:amino acid adenylation domain-containing protein|nr:amino acid adenylation domain-containing protein [Hassallia sp. WJT32-NPBG1]
MKSISEFLSELSSLDIKLWVEGTRLRCNTPKEVLTPVLKAELVERKAEILAYLNQVNLPASSTFPAIQPIPREQNLPLSFAQQRLWFIDQLQPDSSLYNIPTALYLRGKLNITALELTLNEIVRRHEAFRTTFAIVAGQPVQVISPTLTLTVPVVDLQEIPEVDRKTEVLRLVTQEAEQPFDLSQGPLVRATILHLSKLEYVLMLTMHHIVSDGWSAEILIQEVATLYEAFCQGQPSPLPELPIQYADFAVWQRQWLQGDVLKLQLTYWRQQLGGNLPVLQLPTDRPRPEVQTFQGATISFSLPQNLTEALKTVSRNADVTLFMTLLAAFKTLLYRYTGLEDILVGSAIANRNRHEIERLIGFFVNTLVLRTDLSGDPSFRELLLKVREITLQAYAHQDLPFEYLIEELQPERSLNYNPLFQVMFILQNASTQELHLPDLAVSPLYVEKKTAKFHLSLFMKETPSGLTGVFEYNTDLFAPATISRMLEHFYTLLISIVANPDCRVAQLPILSAVEQQLVLQEWNNTQVNYAQNQCLHQLFEVQVDKTPDAIAVVFENEYLTYKELNQKANQLAHYLQKLGVGTEVVVGICVERSLEMVVGLLGILKAGGAYVPLDPSYPQERLTFMLENSQTSILLTQQYLLDILPNTTQLICLDSNWQTIAQENIENPLSNVIVDNLAYVIYTSGSTGKPKAAMNTHWGICNRLLWMQNYCQLTDADRVLQKTPFSFDVSVWEFFLPLLTGARLVVAKPQGHQDSNYLAQLIAEQQITMVHFVPSMLQIFLEEPKIDNCQCLKRVICSGEALPVKLEKLFFNRLNAELHNLYGPTEAAVDVTYLACRNNSTTATVPIGRPIANTQIYLLDKHLQSVPLGVAGELYIGGVGVGRGYFNSSDLTAEKFIPNPFSSEPGTRLYRTGDLARYLPDGNIEFLGRIDNQVKVRGFRIEVGEIEARLSEHPNIREAVVVVQEDELSEKRLIGYVSAYQEQEFTVTELRNFVKEKLPEYMLPSAFVILAALPLTPNGKVDRKSLPTPEILRPKLEVAYVVPQTEAESTIASVWQKALNIKKIGIHDNFFELGGHSLLMVRVHSQLCEIFKTELPLLDLFRYPTISSLAEYFSQITNQTSNFNLTDQETAKLTAGKAQKEKRLQKMRSINI